MSFSHDDLTPFNDLVPDCTKLILGQLSEFERTNLAVTSKYFAGTVKRYNNEDRRSKFYTYLKKKLFKDAFPFSFENLKELFALSNNDFDCLCDFFQNSDYTDCFNIKFLRWLISEKMVKNNSHDLWHIAVAHIANTLKVRELIKVIPENLILMKWLVTKVVDIQDSIGKEPFVVIAKIRELHEGSNKKEAWNERIAEKLFIRFIQIMWGYVNNGQLQLHRSLDFGDEKQFCLSMLSYLQEKLNNDLSVYSQYFDDDVRKVSFINGWLAGREIPNGFVEAMAQLVKIQCLELIGTVHTPLQMIDRALLIVLLKRLGAEKELIKLLLRRYSKTYFDNELHDQIESLNNLIESFPFAIHPDHKKVLFLHLFRSRDFETDKEVYRRYIDSVAKLESNADLNERMITLLEFAFSLDADSAADDDVDGFLEVVIRKSFDPGAFWSQLFDRYGSDMSLIFFAVGMFAENENYKDDAALAAVEFLFSSDYSYFSPKRLRGLLDIKQDNKLWLNDENNQSWFYEEILSKRFSHYEEISNDFQRDFLSWFAEYPHMPARLNQLAAFDVVLSMIGSSSGFGNQGVHVCRVLLTLPDRLYNLMLQRLENLKERALEEQKIHGGFEQLVKRSLWFLKPFTDHGLSCSFEKANVFFNKLSEAQFSDMIGQLNQPDTMLSIIARHDDCIRLKFSRSGISDLYWRFVGLIYEKAHPLAFAKYEEFSVLAEQNAWFRNRGPFEKTFWNPGMPTPKYIRVELTRLIDELSVLPVLTPGKRGCEEEDINPRPAKRSKR